MRELTVAETARKLKVGIDQVRKLIYCDKLVAHKAANGAWRVDAASVQGYMATRRRNGPR